jgi:hypothetical protein
LGINQIQNFSQTLNMRAGYSRLISIASISRSQSD